MPPRLFYWALTSALAGFLFGFDTVVVSGAEKTIQRLWNLSDTLHGLAMGSALWGTVVGSLVGGWPTDRFGRKPTLLGIGLVYFVSAVWSGLAPDVYHLMAARFLGGLGIGVSTIAAPLFIAEIAPPARRGLLTGLFQFNIVFGILVAFLSNSLLAGVGPDAWRWMLGVVAIPALAYTVMCVGLPESPRWLLARGAAGRDAGLRVLRKVNPTASDADLARLADDIQAAARTDAADGGGFWSARLRTPILLAFLVAFFNQLSGINAVLYFAPRIFELTGSQDAHTQSIGIGVTNLIFTFVGLWLIDRLGRRTLLYVGSVGYIVSLGLCTWAFFHWGPQFHAAATALDVKDAAKAVGESVESNRDRRQERLAAKVEALESATRAPGAGTQPVTFERPAAPDAATATAAVVLTQASAGSGPGGLVVVACIFAFIAAHAVGQGAVIWVFISEIFPTRHRASGQALGSFTHWIFAAVLTTVFPRLVTAFAPGWVFAFFCGMMGLQLLWVATLMPETKGVPLEEMERRLGVTPAGG